MGWKKPVAGNTPDIVIDRLLSPPNISKDGSEWSFIFLKDDGEPVTIKFTSKNLGEFVDVVTAQCAQEGVKIN